MADFNKALPVRSSDVAGEELLTKLTDGTTQVDVTASNALKVDGSAVTQPVSAASLPLPTGAATESTLSSIDGKVATETTLSSIDGKVATETTLSSIDGKVATETTLSSVDGKLSTEADDDSIATGTHLATIGLNYGWDGSAWERLHTDTSGSLKVAVTSTSSAASNPENLYATEASLAAGAANRKAKEFNPAASGTFYLSQVWAASSGKMKIDVYVGTSGETVLATIEGYTKLLTGFGSTANPNIDKWWEPDVAINGATDSVYIVFTNLDNQAMDVYGTVSGWS